MTPLELVLLKDIVDCPLTRRYQAALDLEVDRLRQRWDPRRGLLDSAGIELPHEQDANYWELPHADQQRATTPEAATVYKTNAGRNGTAPLGQAAFCWRSPLSRHHGDPELCRCVEAGVQYHVDSIRNDGLMGTFGLNGESWAHGWDVEGLIHALILCGDDLDNDLRRHADDRLPLAAARHAAIPDRPEQMGSYGNQRCVFTLGLQLYGQFLGRSEYRELSDRHFYEAMPKVLDESGQVIEQQGPCAHYSYTAFVYAWLNLAVRADDTQQERLRTCLHWFRARHTDSLYPLAAPSTRQYRETISGHVGDLLPAAEQLAPDDPLPRDWILRCSDHIARASGAPAAMPVGTSHGTSTLMWAILMSGGECEPTAARKREWNRPHVTSHERTQLLKRAPLKYVLVRQGYQTHYTYRDFAPFSGIQTWAWGGEPPIIHPTPLAPSTTQAYGLDTAKEGASHNWGLYGAGLLGIDGYLNDSDSGTELPLLVARYGWLWRVVLFTPVSTVVLEFGNGGERRTIWTLNRVDPAEPTIAAGKVTFAGRDGCLHSTLNVLPALRQLGDEDEWTAGVRQLVYECGTGPVAFGLSNGSLCFPEGCAPQSPLHFEDDSGPYDVHLDPRFFEPNPGNIRVDTFRLAHGTFAKRGTRCQAIPTSF